MNNEIDLFSYHGLLYRRLSVLTTYFSETFKNHAFQRCIEEPRISAKRSKTTYFDEALKNHVFDRSFFSCNFVVAVLYHLDSITFGANAGTEGGFLPFPQSSAHILTELAES